MLIFNTQAELKSHLETHSNNKTIGFVPTMGALHNGHLALVKQAFTQNSICIVSIFINPTQFNNTVDLNKYPRTLESDVVMLKNCSDNIILYCPAVDDIYQGVVVAEPFDFDGLEFQMEGKHRPGHFDGVGTVVKKLFEIVNPTSAYFGEKDFQQLQIIKKMVEKHLLKVKVVACPIFRESNGLAMSSRNERLSANDRAAAKIIFETLQSAKTLYLIKTIDEIKSYVADVFKPLQNFELEYFEIAFEDTLLPCLDKTTNGQCRAFIAVFVNDVRLIDTIQL